MTNQQENTSPSGLDPHVASFLCYLCFGITGLIFLLIERENKKIQFHAWQSIVLSLAGVVLQFGVWCLGLILSSIFFFLSGLTILLGVFIWIVFLVFWVICMIKAYQGEQYKIPILGDIAEKQASQ